MKKCTKTGFTLSRTNENKKIAKRKKTKRKHLYHKLKYLLQFLFTFDAAVAAAFVHYYYIHSVA